jgi:hypothetical protein
MKDFIRNWWKLVAGLVAGYIIGTLVIVQRPVDYGMLLKYLTAIISFPFVTLLLVGGFIYYFRMQIKERFPDIRKVGTGGVELDASKAASEATEEGEAAKEDQRPLKEAIEKLPEGELKREIQRLQAEAATAAQERAIAASLRAQLTATRGNPDAYRAAHSLDTQRQAAETFRAAIQQTVNQTLYEENVFPLNEREELTPHAVLDKWEAFRPYLKNKICKEFSTLIGRSSTKTVDQGIELAFDKFMRRESLPADWD